METNSPQSCRPEDLNENVPISCSDDVSTITQVSKSNQHGKRMTLGHVAMEQSSCVASSSLELIRPVVRSLSCSADPYQDVESVCNTKQADVHLVPNIVVEHVLSLPSVDTPMPPQRLENLPQLRSSLSELSSAMQSAAVSRQSRASSDSSLHYLEKSLYCSSSHRIEQLEYLSDSINSSTTSLNCGVVTDKLMANIKANTFPSSVAIVDHSRDLLSTRKLDENRLSVPSVTAAVVQPSDASSQGFLSSPRFCGPQRSPKAYWLRRHSDSNLESGHEGSSGLRVEPYPIRSHSTGNSFVASAMSSCSPSSSSNVGDFRSVAVEEPSSNMKPSTSLHRSQESMESSSYRCTVESERKCYQSSSVLTEPDSVIPSQSRVISTANDLESNSICQESFRMSNRTDRKEIVSEGNKVGSYQESDDSTLSGQRKPSGLVHCAVIMEKTVTAEKRLKLKKYLQTRYQLSQRDGVFPLSESDDVFVDRFASPGPFTPLLRHANGNTALDLVLRNNRPSSDSIAEFQRLSSNSESHAVSGRVDLLGPNSHPGTMLQSCRPHSDSGSSLTRNEYPDDRLSIKEEPGSPRAIPRGTSVFVFPPPPLMQLDDATHGSPQSVHSLHSNVSPMMASILQHHSCSSFGIGSSVVSTFQHDPVSILECATKHRESVAQSTGLMECSFSAAASSVASDSSVLGELSNDTARLPATSCASFLLKCPADRSRVQTGSVGGMLRTSQSFVCPLCSVAFQSCGNLTDHMAVHVTDTSSPSEAVTGPESCAGSSKPAHLCPICQRTFSRGDMLTRHVRLHTGVRPYECTLCSQVFSRSDHLTTHQRTHTGEKPYRCPVCAYAAPRRDMVTRHVRIHETQSGGVATYGRRGRKASSLGGGQVPGVPAVARVQPLRLETVNPMNFQRHRSKSEYAVHHPSSHSSVADGSAFDEHRESLASTTESVNFSRSLVPVTCRSWSTTSAESFESYPGSYARGTSVSSVTADSPDVFLHHPRHFQWGSEARMRISSEDIVAADIAGVTPVFQKCSVTTPPLLRDHGSDIGDAD